MTIIHTFHIIFSFPRSCCFHFFLLPPTLPNQKRISNNNICHIKPLRTFNLAVSASSELAKIDFSSSFFFDFFFLVLAAASLSSFCCTRIIIPVTLWTIRSAGTTNSRANRAQCCKKNDILAVKSKTAERDRSIRTFSRRAQLNGSSMNNRL